MFQNLTQLYSLEQNKEFLEQLYGLSLIGKNISLETLDAKVSWARQKDFSLTLDSFLDRMDSMSSILKIEPEVWINYSTHGVIRPNTTSFIWISADYSKENFERIATLYENIFSRKLTY